MADDKLKAVRRVLAEPSQASVHGLLRFLYAPELASFSVSDRILFFRPRAEELRTFRFSSVSTTASAPLPSVEAPLPVIADAVRDLFGPSP